MNSTKSNNILVKDYEELSKKCGNVLLDCVIQKPDAMICLATGYSPQGAYRYFVEEVKKKEIDLSKVTFVKLDEWYGLEMDDPATCEYYISTEILKPLGIPNENYIGFNSMANDPEEECIRISHELDRRGPIDLMILGIGRNGHLGLNEPGEKVMADPHVAVLDHKTKGHQMLGSASKPVELGLTLGMKDMLDSEQTVLLVTGADKTDAFASFMRDGVTTQVPATFVKLHKNFICIVEETIA